jgi:hypothetical protein
MTRYYRIGLLITTVFLLLNCTEDSTSSVATHSSEASLNKSVEEEGNTHCGAINSHLTLISRAKEESSVFRKNDLSELLRVSKGELQGNLQGTVEYVTSLHDNVAITSRVGNPPANQTVSYTGTLTITTRDGKLVFRDVGVLEQIPNGLGSSIAILVEAEGSYSGARGYLQFTYITSENQNSLEGNITGYITCSLH